MAQPERPNETTPPATEFTRKPYRTPQLYTYGDLAEVTRNMGAPGAFDNPSGVEHKTH